MKIIFFTSVILAILAEYIFTSSLFEKIFGSGFGAISGMLLLGIIFFISLIVYFTNFYFFQKKQTLMMILG